MAKNSKSLRWKNSLLGKFIASIVMIMGYAIIAVPTGIVSAELVHARQSSITHCPFCGGQL